MTSVSVFPPCKEQFSEELAWPCRLAKTAWFSDCPWYWPLSQSEPSWPSFLDLSPAVACIFLLSLMSASLCQDLSAALQTVEHGCGGTEFKTQTGLLLRLVNVGLSPHPSWSWSGSCWRRGWVVLDVPTTVLLNLKNSLQTPLHKKLFGLPLLPDPSWFLGTYPWSLRTGEPLEHDGGECRGTPWGTISWPAWRD